MFVTRELLTHFDKKGGGVLAFVMHTDGPAAGGPLDKTITAAFAAFAGGLLGNQDAEKTIGFSSDIPSTGEQTDAFAAFIIKLLTAGRKTDRGRWHKFGKLNLFGR